jgi:D-alanyl-D-alanine carboxypeptidase
MRWLGGLLLIAIASLFVACGGDDGEAATETMAPTAVATEVVTETVAPTATATPEPVTACVQSMVHDGTEHLLLRADKEQALPDGYTPDVVQLQAPYILQGWTDQYLIPEAANALMEMLDDAREVGYDIVVRSSYRSYDEQVWTFQYWVDQVGEAQAERESARPGHSEHQLGQTVDLTSASVGCDLSQDFGDTPEGQWLQEHMQEYGFALSYPKGKEDITGYIYEPWHLRYVGRACAQEWKDSRLTLIEVLRGDQLKH